MERGEIAPKEQFLLLSTIFSYLMLDFYVKTSIRFSLRDKRLFEITEVETTRVDCSCKKLLPGNSWAKLIHGKWKLSPLKSHLCKILWGQRHWQWQCFWSYEIFLVLNLTWQVCCYMTPDHCCLTLAWVASAWYLRKKNNFDLLFVDGQILVFLSGRHRDSPYCKQASANITRK